MPVVTHATFRPMNITYLTNFLSCDGITHYFPFVCGVIVQKKASGRVHGLYLVDDLSWWVRDVSATMIFLTRQVWDRTHLDISALCCFLATTYSPARSWAIHLSCSLPQCVYLFPPRPKSTSFSLVLITEQDMIMLSSLVDELWERAYTNDSSFIWANTRMHAMFQSWGGS